MKSLDDMHRESIDQYGKLASVGLTMTAAYVAAPLVMQEKDAPGWLKSTEHAGIDVSDAPWLMVAVGLAFALYVWVLSKRIPRRVVGATRKGIVESPDWADVSSQLDTDGPEWWVPSHGDSGSYGVR